MKPMQTPIEFGKNFLNAYYRNRDAAECLGYFAEDIIWVTPEDAVHLREQEEIFAYIKQQIEAMGEPYYVDVAETMSDPASEEVRAVSYVCSLVPKDPAMAKHVRATILVKNTAAGMVITSLHISRRFRASDTGAFSEFLAKLPDEHMVLQSRSGQNLRLLSSNDHLAQSLGYKEEEYRPRMKKDPLFMLREQDRKRLRRRLAALQDEEQRIRVEARDKGGGRHSYELARRTDGRPVIWCSGRRQPFGQRIAGCGIRFRFCREWRTISPVKLRSCAWCAAPEQNRRLDAIPARPCL